MVREVNHDKDNTLNKMTKKPVGRELMMILLKAVSPGGCQSWD